MKLRLRSNTLRLRLSRAELATLLATGAVEDHTPFSPTSSLRYRIEVSPSATTPTAILSPAAITIRISPADLHAWSAPTTVGLYARQPIDAHHRLEISLEKDFTCLEPRPSGEDDGSFPHPLSGNSQQSKPTNI